ncbi:MAG: hypothetical protein N2594_07795 [Clostridiales bacterium]|nr:hypothetical protein [Clostridiales bacterium]
MLSLFRLGPKLMVLGTENPDELIADLLRNFDAKKLDLSSALNFSSENSTVVFITKPNQKIAHIKDMFANVLINMNSEDFMSSLINLKLLKNINDIRSAPGIIIMRTQGDKDKIISSVALEYQAEMSSIFDSIDRGHSNQTIIVFTDKPIEENVPLNSIESTTLLVDRHISFVASKIRNQALRFLNEGLVNKNWYELNIRIYDRYSQYDLHYRRLSAVLDELDIGLILGEMWTKDSPRFLMTVLVYQIRLFSLIPPVDIKRILLGLEYTDDGTRIVDFDLMHKNKKVDWTDARIRNLERRDLGMYYKQEILKNLSQETKEKLRTLDEMVLNLRD